MWSRERKFFPLYNGDNFATGMIYANHKKLSAVSCSALGIISGRQNNEA